jgi:hypothetical protein
MFMPHSFQMFGRATDWEAAVADLSPTAWWRLGESSGVIATDENGAFDGTYVASPSLNQNSLVVGDENPCVGLNGANELVTMGDVLNPDDSDFSVVFWVKPDTLSAVQRPMQKRGSGAAGTQPGWQIGFTSTGINNTVIETANGGNAVIGVSEQSGYGGISTSVPGMIALTWSNANERMRLYVNGSLEATGTVSGSMAGESVTTTRPLTIGCSDNGGGTRSQFWDGFVDEALFFLGTELTSTDISNLYSAGS